MAGAGVTMTGAELAMAVSATAVAVTVTFKSAETAVGALNVTELVVVLLKVPTAPPPEMLQITPLPLESFSTVALNLMLCPWSTSVWAEGEIETESTGVGGEVLATVPPPPLPPPQPHIRSRLQIARQKV